MKRFDPSCKNLKETYVDYVTRIVFGRVGLELIEKPFDQLSFISGETV